MNKEERQERIKREKEVIKILNELDPSKFDLFKVWDGTSGKTKIYIFALKNDNPCFLTFFVDFKNEQPVLIRVMYKEHKIDRLKRNEKELDQFWFNFIKHPSQRLKFYIPFILSL